MASLVSQPRAASQRHDSAHWTDLSDNQSPIEESAVLDTSDLSAPQFLASSVSLADDASNSSLVLTEDRLCRTCETLDFHALFFTDIRRYQDEDIKWESESVVHNSSCPFCRFLFHATALQSLRKHSKYHLTGISQPYASYQLEDWSSRCGRRLLINRALESQTAISILPLTTVSSSSLWESPRDYYGDLFHGRDITSGSIDLVLISKWLQRCHETHPPQVCNPKAPLSSALHKVGFRLINVDMSCIIEATTEEHFLALSYVWGCTGQIRLTAENVNSLMQHGALDRVELPKTISDAIVLCRLLKESYLWVDSLCIIEDEGDEKESQIMHMDSIYRRAHLTIIAAAGPDCSSGLPGITRKRTITQSKIRIQDLDLITVQASVYEELYRSTWNSRGWTFQESVLSCRRLIFLPNQVFFSCGVGDWIEDTCLEVFGAVKPVFWRRHDFPRLALDDLEGRTKEDLFRNVYVHLLNSYLRRDLSKAADILNAFSGITTALRPYLGPFIYGVPRELFSVSLTWSEDDIPERRQGFPSWSWAGWVHSSTTKVMFPAPVNVDPILTAWFLSRTGKVIRIRYEALAPMSHPLLRAHFGQPRRPVEEGLEVLLRTWRTPPHVLAFYTSSAKFVVLPSEKRFKGSAYYSKLIPSSKVLDYEDYILVNLGLPEDWLLRRPSSQEFIAVAEQRSSRKLFVVLVEWIEGIAYRVNMAQILVPVAFWLRARPQRKAVLLG
ncbi:HET-domain-containing protein [Mytilinidion resinicola]|uniref:HET-domain-containing protein n=1 Tax=Mytilinidion resinicola TaxID=574789 RepID=A0A6A6Z8S7_9PEZI|nr:HET-domain-containing protein [Mytilinidion resinicola]KAF2817208.1 HET-domain-containing protein [Mytilinidion resinicola]